MWVQAFFDQITTSFVEKSFYYDFKVKMNCFNCGESTHIPRYCPYPQQSTRCPSCGAVARIPERHKEWCNDPSFVSTFIHDKSARDIVEMKELMSIEFLDVSDTFCILDHGREIVIGTNLLWIYNIGAYVQKENRTLKFLTTWSMKRNLTIVNANDEPVLSIVDKSTNVNVNGRFEMKEDGWISFHN